MGGISVKRDLPLYIQQKVNRVLQKSVEFALQNNKESYAFVKRYAQELKDEVIQQHIQLYVNSFTIDLGEKGKNAVESLFNNGIKNQIIPAQTKQIFISTN